MGVLLCDSVAVVGVLSVMFCLLTSGVVWGWSSLLPVLEQEHVYSNYCTHNDSEQGICPHQV